MARDFNRNTPSLSRSMVRHILPGLAAAMLLAGCEGGAGSGMANPSSVGGRYILALGDADLPTEPGSSTMLPTKPGLKDSLTVISLPIREPSTPFAQADVSSSALGSPGQIAVSPDGRFAYVVETRGPALDVGARSVASLTMGDSLTSIDLTNLSAPKVLSKTYVGPDPRAVAVHPSGNYVAVVTTNARNQLIVAPLGANGGVPGESIAWPLNGLDDDEAAPTAVAWHPSGRAIAVSLGNRAEVIFYRFKVTGESLELAPWGGPVKVGKQPIFGQFSKDGKHFVSLDAGSSRTQSDGQPLGPGRISVIRLDDNLDSEIAAGAHTVIASADTALAPTGMAISPDGTLIACANGLVSVGSESRRGGSIVLYSLARDGRLTTHGESLLGAVPAGVTFDTTGRFLCVSQYASLDPEAYDGEVSFWRLVRKDGAPSLEQQDFFLGIGGGPHSAIIIR